MIDYSEKELALIDRYAVHILAGLINSPSFDPSEYKSTTEMMIQQCDLSFVYAETLLISRNRFMQDKKNKLSKKLSSDIYLDKKDDTFTKFLNEKIKESDTPITPMKSRGGVVGIFDSYISYCKDIGIEERFILNLSRFGKSFKKQLMDKGFNIQKIRNSKGTYYNVEIIN